MHVRQAKGLKTRGAFLLYIITSRAGHPLANYNFVHVGWPTAAGGILLIVLHLYSCRLLCFNLLLKKVWNQQDHPACVRITTNPQISQNFTGTRNLTWLSFAVLQCDCLCNATQLSSQRLRCPASGLGSWLQRTHHPF